MIKMKKIKITKIGIQPGGEISTYNSLNEEQYGYVTDEPKVGERFIVYKYEKVTMFDAWSTSIVTEIIDNNTFNTIYSKYRWEYVNE